MTNPDSSNVVQWPKVPACYGWLSLDRRGCWRLKGQVISHRGLISFINSHYDADGSWAGAARGRFQRGRRVWQVGRFAGSVAGREIFAAGFVLTVLERGMVWQLGNARAAKKPRAARRHARRTGNLRGAGNSCRADIMASLFDQIFGEWDAMKKPDPVKPEKQTYEQWRDEQIKLGLADLDAGRVVSHEDVMKRGKALIERLKRKHAKAA